MLRKRAVVKVSAEECCGIKHWWECLRKDAVETGSDEKACRKGEAIVQTENKNTEAILVLERQIYNYQRANAELQTGLGERSLMQKFGPYLLLFGWFLALEFMKNWMGFFVDITGVAYIPIVLVFVVLLVLEYRRDKRRQETMEQIKANRHRCDELRQQIETLRGRM